MKEGIGSQESGIVKTLYLLPPHTSYPQPQIKPFNALNVLQAISLNASSSIGAIVLDFASFFTSPNQTDGRTLEA